MDTSNPWNLFMAMTTHRRRSRLGSIHSYFRDLEINEDSGEQYACLGRVKYHYYLVTELGAVDCTELY